MKRAPVRLLPLMLILAAIPAMAQEPEILDVSKVVVGSQRLETLWAYTAGKWSDAGNDAGVLSTEIHCYQRFGFCEVANASSLFGMASVSLESFDILRWDAGEMIAVDSSLICAVNTLRIDFATKKVSLSYASKGDTRDKFCKEDVPDKTVFLTGRKDEMKRIDDEARQKRK